MVKQLKIIKSRVGSKRILIPFLIFSLLLAVVAFYWFIQQTKWLNEDYTEQITSTRLEENYQDLIYYLQRGESDVRGYTLSHNENFTTDFAAVIDSIESKYIKIKSVLEAENEAVDTQLLVRFDTLFLKKIEVLKQIKILCDENKWSEAANKINTRQGLYLTDSVYFVNQIRNAQLRRYNEAARNSFMKIRDRNTNLAYLAASFALLILLVSVYFLFREVKRSELLTEELNIQKDFFKTTVDSLGEGLIATSRKGEIVFMNPAAEKLTGWSFDQARNKPLSSVYKVYNEETGLPFQNIVSRILDAGKSVELENNTLLKSRNNEFLVISNNGAPLFGEDGTVNGAVLVFNDITEKKKNEDELRESERQFRHLIENLPEAVYTCDNLGYIQLYNKAAVNLWGREPLAGKELWVGSWKIFSTDGNLIEREHSQMATAIKEQRQVSGKEIIVQRPDGTQRHVLPCPTPMFNREGELTGAVNMLIDITDKKEREVLIQKTEEKYRALFEQGNDAIVMFSFDGTIYEFNDIICSMSGYTREEFSQKKLGDIIVGDLIMSVEKYDALLAGKMVTLARQCRRKDGGLVDMEFKVKINSEGTVVAFGRDITERKRNEEMLKAAVERFEILSQATSDTVWDWNIKEDSISYNKGITTMFGYDRSEIKARAEWWKKNAHPDDTDEIDKKLDELFKTKGQNIKLEYRYRCADGSYKYIKDRAFVIYDEEGNPVRMVGAMQDVTTEKVHDRLISMAVIETQENERRELGMELHDNVNQLLSATLLYLGMAARASKEGQEVSTTIEECTGYINSAINDIRNLSHRLSPLTSEQVALIDIVKWLTEPMQKSGKLEINTNIEETVDELITNEIKTNFYRIIQEQLTNILKHANATKVDIAVTVVDSKLQLTITDDGVGFEPEAVKSGIGLQNIKRRAEIFFGEFSLHTSPGKGCRLTVTQPFG